MAKEDKIYRVEAFFFIKAKDAKDAERIIRNEDDFIENHIIIKEASNDDYENIMSGMESVYNQE